MRPEPDPELDPDPDSRPSSPPRPHPTPSHSNPARLQLDSNPHSHQLLAILEPPSLSWLGGESGGGGGGGASPRDGADAGAEADLESVDLLGELLEQEPSPVSKAAMALSHGATPKAPPATAPPSHADHVEAPPPSPPSPPGGMSRAFTALGTSLSSLLPGAGGRKRRSTLSARQRQHVESTALSNELAV